MLVSGVGSGGPKSAALRFCGYRLRWPAEEEKKRCFVGLVKMMFNKCNIYIYMYYTTRWWQLKYVSNFHLENWGR